MLSNIKSTLFLHRTLGIFGGQKIKSGKCHELPRKLTPTPPGVGSFIGNNFKCLGHFTNCRENRYFLLASWPPPHPTGGGGLGVKISK